MTDVTMNESEHKVPDVNTRSPRASDNSRRVVQSKNEHGYSNYYPRHARL